MRKFHKATFCLALACVTVLSSCKKSDTDIAAKTATAVTARDTSFGNVENLLSSISKPVGYFKPADFGTYAPYGSGVYRPIPAGNFVMDINYRKEVVYSKPERNDLIRSVVSSVMGVGSGTGIEVGDVTEHARLSLIVDSNTPGYHQVKLASFVFDGVLSNGKPGVLYYSSTVQYCGGYVVFNSAESNGRTVAVRGTYTLTLGLVAKVWDGPTKVYLTGYFNIPHPKL